MHGLQEETIARKRIKEVQGVLSQERWHHPVKNLWEVPALCDKTPCNSFTKKRFLTNFKTSKLLIYLHTILQPNLSYEIAHHNYSTFLYCFTNCYHQIFSFHALVSIIYDFSDITRFSSYGDHCCSEYSGQSTAAD
ncbi:hypothetical protein Dsin_007648 [Dipteronia sinensis]|uniref:Uncharacterized protein n=1 Tax=Dipteronia sinensis TaxID=43782 RepID=A0AAE0B0J8_9ROSI|nr:hypothetical protein Dsin_007648 [Dipteronia sinensis]